jgi:hypothetical protein
MALDGVRSGCWRRLSLDLRGEGQTELCLRDNNGNEFRRRCRTLGCVLRHSVGDPRRPDATLSRNKLEAMVSVGLWGPRSGGTPSSMPALGFAGMARFYRALC